MKNIFKIIFVIIGTLIGAGFASGQEIYIFFYSYGINGIYGLIISSVLMGLIIYKTLNIVNKYNINNYKDFINIIINKKYKNNYLNINYIINIIINVFILITFFIMIAGFGAYFEQVLGISHYIGSTILALLCYIVFNKNIKGLININQLLIPFLIIFILIIGIFNLIQINHQEIITTVMDMQSSGWLLKSVLYGSYNSILLIPTLIALRNYIKNKNNNYLISLFSIIIIIIISFLLFFILINIKTDISKIEMPVVYAVGKMFEPLIYVYGFIIISSIFTTSISVGTSFLQNISKNQKSFTQIAFIMCIIAVVISDFGFSNLVNLLYPIFGYLGLIQIIALLCKKIY